MSVDFLLEIAKTCGKFTYYRCCGVIFFGPCLVLSLNSPVPAGLSTPFCFLHQLMLQVAKVFAYKVACNGKLARIKQAAHCPPCMMTQMFPVWYSNSCWSHSGSRGELVSAVAKEEVNMFACQAVYFSSYLRKIWKVNSSVSQLIVLAGGFKSISFSMRL